MATIDAKRVKQILDTGQIQEFQGGYFTLLLDDGTKETFAADRADFAELAAHFGRLSAAIERRIIKETAGDLQSSGLQIEARIKPVRRFEIGLDTEGRQIVWTGIHFDETRTTMAIAEPDIKKTALAIREAGRELARRRPKSRQ